MAKNENKDKYRYKNARPLRVSFGIEIMGKRVEGNEAYVSIVCGSTQEDIQKAVDKIYDDQNATPTIPRIIFRLLIDRYFADLDNSYQLLSQETIRHVKDSGTLMTKQILSRLDAERKSGAKPCEAFLKKVLYSIIEEYRNVPLIHRDYETNKAIYALELTMFNDKQTRDLVESHLRKYSDKDKHTAECLLEAFVRTAFATYGDINEDDWLRVVGFFLIDLQLASNKLIELDLAKVLYELSQDKKEKPRIVALELYERFGDSIKYLFKKYPRYNYVNSGLCVEYADIADFVKKVRQDADIFVEKAEIEKIAAKKANSPKIPRLEERYEHQTRVLEAMAQLIVKARRLASEIHVLNILPNEIKEVEKGTNPPARKHSQYLAVAFLLNGEWIIVVDSVRLNSAAYIWHGASYPKGLETLKQSRVYVMDDERVKRCYHTSIKGDKKPYIEVYQALLRKIGIEYEIA